MPISEFCGGVLKSVVDVDYHHLSPSTFPLLPAGTSLRRVSSFFVQVAAARDLFLSCRKYLSDSRTPCEGLEEIPVRRDLSYFHRRRHLFSLRTDVW